MKDKWYGDKRDLVKWGVLLQLASRYRTSRIVQVAYYRPETLLPKQIEIDSHEYRMREAVYKRFRNLMEIERLSSPSVQIKIVNSVWSVQRRANYAYLQEVKAELRQLPIDSPGILFLDPDTGLEPPKSKPKLERVLESELTQIWKEAVRVKDVLVFYQPKAEGKKGESWIKPKKEQFECALGLSNGAGKMARSAVL